VPEGKASFMAKVFLVLGLVVCGMMLVEHLSGWDFGLDEAVFRDTASVNKVSPGRMSLNTAIAFLLLNTALLILPGGSGRGRRTTVVLLSGLTVLLGLFAVLGWTGNVTLGFDWGDLSSMALHTGVGFVLLGMASGVQVWRKAGFSVAIGRRPLVGLGLGLAVFVALSMASYESASQLAETEGWVRHTYQVLTKIERVDGDLIDVQTAVAEYVISGKQDFLVPYRNALANLREDEHTVRWLTADNPSQQERLTAMEELIRQQLAFSEETLDVHRQGGLAAAAALISTGRGQEMMKSRALLISALKQEEWRLLTQREAQARSQRTRTFFILPVGTFIGVGLFVTVLFFLNSEAAERLATEAPIRLSAEIVRSTGDAVITKTLGGIITSWNPGAEAIFGYTAPEIVGHSVMMLIPLDLADEERDILARVGRGERVEHFETVRLRKDGRRANVSVTVSPLIDHTGSVAGASKILRDITGHKRAEEELRRSEGRYRALFENAPDGILIADPQSTYLDANASMCNMLGYSSEELIGMHATDIVIPAEFEHIEPALSAIKGPTNYNREWRFRRKDTSIFAGEVIATAMPDGNLVGIVRDITERKQTERRLEMRNAVSRVLASAASLAEATPGIISAICEAELWDLGSIWEVDAAAQVLRCTDVWYHPDFQGRAMADESRTLSFAQSEGLPGRVWAAGKMELIEDVAQAEGYLRRRVATAAGVKSALAFPIFVGNEVTGVMDFAAREIRQPDGELIDMFVAIGRQVGLFVGRQRAQDLLREGEQRFRTMANSIPQLAWIAHADGFIYWYNERWYEYTGTTPGQMEGWGWQTVHDPELLPEVMSRWTSAIGSGRLFEMEFPLRAADGKFRAFLTRVQPLKDAEGRVVQWFGTNTDIEELKRTQESLRASQARLNSTLSAGSIGTWTWDIVNDRLAADEFTARMFSIEPAAAAKGLPAEVYLRAVSKEDQQGVADALARAIESCGGYDIEYRVPQTNGELRWLQAKGRVEGDAAGNALHFHGAVIDVTDRKRTEGRLRRLVDSNVQGVMFWNLKGDITHANDAFLRIVGYTREDQEAGRIQWTAITPPEYAHLDRRSLDELSAKGICAPFEKEYIRKDGSRVPILLGAAMFDDSPDEGVCFLIDITERKQTDRALAQSEEHFRFLNDLSEQTRTLANPDQIMAVTARMLGRHLRVSRCAYADVDTDGEAFTILDDYTDGCASTVGNYQLSLFGERAVSTLHDGQTLIIRNVEAELASDGGADMFNAIGIQAIITCPLVKDGVLRAMMAVHQTKPRDWKPSEITIVHDVVERCWATIERRMAEESIRQLNADLEKRVLQRTGQLEAANQELEAFSYSVSHDLRAPLRAVDGFSQAVLEDYGEQLPEEGLRYLRTIRNGAQRMGALIDDLLEFARLNRQSLNKRVVDTEKLVREVIEDLQQEGRQLEISIGDLPKCQGDSALLKQVWINLLSNALKYTGKCERPVVEIGCLRENNEDIYFVRDNGTGFDMKFAHKLFGVFQRLHRAEEYEGTGVGLAIVQRVIHRHGGRVWAKAVLEHGATFYFTLEQEAKS